MRRYFQPNDMLLLATDLIPADLAAIVAPVAPDFETQCALLCYGPSPTRSWLVEFLPKV